MSLPNSVDDTRGRRDGLCLRALPFLGALLAVSLALGKQGEKTLDDAFILFRYAESLATGHGLTFNPGERVEGYSSLLFVLLLSAGRAAGIPYVLASNVCNLLGVALAAWATFHLARHVPIRDAGVRTAGCLAAAALVATSDGFVNYGLLGLETAFAGGLLALALQRRWEEEARGSAPIPSGALFGLLAITRPEGALPYLMCLLGGLPSPRREARRAALALGIPAGQVVFRLIYYGELLPNTYHAKIWSSWDRYRRGASYVLEHLEGLGPLLVLLGLLGALTLLGRRPVRELALVTAGGLFFGIYSGGDLYTSHRFLVPTFPASAALLAAGATALLARAGRRLGPALLLVLVALTVARAPGFGSWRRYATPPASFPARVHEGLRHLHEPTETLQVRVGKFLAEKVPENSWIVVGDCGRIPFYSGLRTIDSLGLMDPNVARSPGRVNEKLAVDYLLARDADLYLLRQSALTDYPRPGGLRVDHLLIHRSDFHATRSLAAYFPFHQHGYILFAKEERLILDLSRAVSKGAAATTGSVLPSTRSAVLREEDRRHVIGAITERPFAMIEPRSETSRLARYLWSFPTLVLSQGATLRVEVQEPSLLELGIAEDDVALDVTDGSGKTQRVSGRDLLFEHSVSAGTLTLRLEAGPSAELLCPRLMRR